MAGKQPQRKKQAPAILRVTPLDGHRLSIEFGSGSILELNMENRLRTVRYYPLNDARVFFSAATDGSKILFDTSPKFELDIFAQEAADMALTWTGEGRAILLVRPLEHCRIRLELKNGSALELNLENRLHTVRYGPLQDTELFQSAATDGTDLLFGDVLRIDAQELANLMLTVPPDDPDPGAAR